LFFFRHDTPKYGLIYHASLVGQAPPKLKGKVSRTLAAKTALSIRVDALGECDGVTIGFEGKEKVELRLKQLETGTNQKSSSSAVKAKPAQEKYNKPDAASVDTATLTAQLARSSSPSLLPLLMMINQSQTVFKVIRMQTVDNESY